MAAPQVPGQGASSSGAEAGAEFDEVRSQSTSSPLSPEPPRSARSGPQEEFIHVETRECIYSLMLVYPEVCRIKRGSYRHPQVVLAAVLFIINVVLQVSLTHIAGSQILRQNRDYRRSLLGLDGSWSTPVDWLEAGLEAVLPSYAEQETGCCRGRGCSSEATCCPPGVPASPSLLHLDGGGSAPAAVAAARSSSGLPATPRADVISSPRRTTSSSRRPGVRTPLRGSGRLHLAAEAQPDSGGEAGAIPRIADTEELRNNTDELSKKTTKELTKKRIADTDAEERRMRTKLHQKSISLCSVSNKTVDCSQPSFAILDKWDQLDTNGDGLWTRAEAERDEANLACHIGKGISMEQAFDAVFRGLQHHATDILKLKQVPPELQSKIAISRSYFELWRGMTVLCTAWDVNRCSRLIIDGVFDGALDGNHGKKGKFLLENALDICVNMLEEGGVCDAAHPSTYIMWQQHSKQMCGKPLFNSGDSYTNPYNKDDSIDLLFVAYSEVSELNMANSFTFQCYVGFILFIWYINLLREFFDTLDLFDLVIHFPTCYKDPFKTKEMFLHLHEKGGDLVAGKVSISDLGNLMHHPSQEELDQGRIIIREFSSIHKATLCVMIAVRLFLLVYMAGAGTVFALKTYSYIDLLLNAVALAFIFELPEFLYFLLVGNDVKQEIEDVKFVHHKTVFKKDGGGVLSFMTSNIVWGLVILPLFVIAIVKYNEQVHTYPVYEALRCACEQRGDRCVASHVLNRDWWTSYWQNNHLV